MSRILTIQVCLMVLTSGMLGGLLFYTNVYDDVKSRIVSVLCLGCLKLDPKTQLDFTFNTANDVGHPLFVLENLTIGPVFLHYRDDVCPACDEMEPIIKEIFGVDYGIEEKFYKTLKFNSANVTFIHINLDHTDQEKRNSFEVYDKDHVGGVPMFTVVTIGYDHGFVKPCYTTAYGTLGKNRDEERKEMLTQIVKDGIIIYEQNAEGYTFP